MDKTEKQKKESNDIDDLSKTLAATSIKTPSSSTTKKGQFGGSSRSAAVKTKGAELEDDYYTPPEATVALLKYLEGKKVKLDKVTALEHCYGVGHIADVLEEYKMEVIKRDKYTLPESHDILETPIPSKAQAIITNPPYGIKYDIIEWAYRSKSPWAMLLPFDIVITIKGQRIFQNHPYTVCLLTLE